MRDALGQRSHQTVRFKTLTYTRYDFTAKMPTVPCGSNRPLISNPFLSVNGLLLPCPREVIYEMSELWIEAERCFKRRNCSAFSGTRWSIQANRMGFPKLDVRLHAGDARFKLPESELSILTSASG